MFIAFLERIWNSDGALSAVVTGLILLIGYFLRPRGKVTWGVLHYNHFIVPPVTPPPPQGVQPQGQVQQNSPALPPGPPLQVFVRDVWIENTGRATVSNLEIVLNYKPQHFEVWAPRSYSQSDIANGRFALTFPNLNAKEGFRIAILNVGAQVPEVVNMRWDGGVGAMIALVPRRDLPKWAQLLVALDMIAGLFAFVYAVSLLVRYLAS